MCDRVSQLLALGVFESVPHTYGNVPRYTLYARIHERRLIDERAVSQQCLYPWEEAAIVRFVLQMSNMEHPVQ